MTPGEVSSESESGSESGNLSEGLEPTLVANPQVGEHWFFVGVGEEGNQWERIGGDRWFGNHETTGYKPAEGKEYLVSYRDFERVCFYDTEARRATIEWFYTKEVIHELEDILEPGDEWEITRVVNQERTWRRIRSIPGQPFEYAIQKIGTATIHTLKINTPYRLVEWTAHIRIWTDLFNNQRVVELLRKLKEVCATIRSE